MRFFANLFLVLFAVDGGISVMDEFLSLLLPGIPLSVVRALVANLVLVLAVPMYLSTGIDRRLPKGVFLPLTMFVFLCPVVASLFPAISSTYAFGFGAAFMQVALILLPLIRNRKRGDRGILMPGEMFRQPFFSRKNTLIFGAVNLFVIPIALALFIVSAVNSYLYQSTAGFMRLGPRGLYMTEKIYRRGDKTIRLVSMVHIGKEEFYEGLVRSIPSGRTVVLAEGVTDDGNLLRNRLDYGKMAGFLGVASQEKMRFKGRYMEAEEMEDPPEEARQGREPDIVRADVDMASFRPTTVYLLDVMGRYMRAKTSIGDGMLDFYAWSGKHVTPTMYETLMDDIRTRRNRVVIGHLGNAIPRYDNIVIPWGALHLPEIERAVVAKGFVLQKEREIESIEFSRILGARSRNKAGSN